MPALALLLLATCGYLHWEVQQLKRELRTQRKVVNDTLNAMEDQVDRIVAEQARLGETGMEMQRLLPAMRDALKVVVDLNKTY